MRKPLLLGFMACIYLTTLGQTTTAVIGTIKDAQTNSPLEGATIALEGAKLAALSDRQGRFQLKPVNPGNYNLTITYIGYQPHLKDLTLAKGETTRIDISLVPDTRPGNEVVISAFLKPEKISEAAAAIHIINRKAFEQFAGSNPLELMAMVPGIEYTRNGVDDITFNARGLHSAFNNRVLQIIDGRNGMAALSGSLPIMNRSTIIKDDMEKLEVMLGPQSAIYGPNAHNAVFNFVTKDPRKHIGTTLSTSVGSRSQFSTRFRHAHVINQNWAYKITGEHAIGREYEHYDSIYAGNQNGNMPFYGPPVAIPDRIDFNFKHLRGEASLYYTPRPGTDLILSGGTSEHNWPQVTTGGRNQMKGIIYAFVQAKLVSKHWYASIYNTWGSLGTSYGLGGYTRDYWNRTHSTLPASDPLRGRLSPDSAELFAKRIGGPGFKEESQRLNADVRYSHNFSKARLFVALSTNYQEDRPNGYGITLVDSFHRIHVRQFGTAAQAEKHFPYGFRVVAATRFDHHENFGNFLSPRIALVKSAGRGFFRVSWSKAYSMPTIQNQYAGINRNLFGNRSGVLYLPNGLKVSDQTARVTTISLKPEQISSWEIGFKGNILKNLYLDMNAYYSISKNFISPSRSVGGRAFAVNGIPVTHNPNSAGDITNGILKGASFSTYFNYGEVNAHGLDIVLRYAFYKNISMMANYSWFGSDITKNDPKNDANRDGYVSLEETSLNAPRNRGLLALQLERIVNKRCNATISARYVERYNFYSGSQVGTEEGKGRRGVVYGGPDPTTGAPRNYLKNFNHGPLGGFTTIDLSTTYNFNDNLRLNIGVTNLLNTKQREFVGSPSISRLIMAEVRITVW